MTDHCYILKDKIPIPVSLLEWGKWLETNRHERIVQQEQVGRYWVSTVFMGLDHNFGQGPPVLFETMIFEQVPERQLHRRQALDYQERYTTWELALEGHRRAVEVAKERQ